MAFVPGATAPSTTCRKKIPTQAMTIFFTQGVKGGKLNVRVRPEGIEAVGVSQCSLAPANPLRFWSRDARILHHIRPRGSSDLLKARHLTCAARVTKYYQCGLIDTEAIMVLCPDCENNLDLDEDGVDEGEVISCPECGTDFEVVTVSPLELKAMEEAKYEEDDEEEETEDGDYS